MSDLIAEGRAVLEANAIYGVVKLGRWARANLGDLLDALESQRTQIAALRARLEPPDSTKFDALLKELGIDMTDPQEVLAEKVVQQREHLNVYRDAMRDVRRILTDVGVTNPPPRLAAVLEGLD